MLISLSTGAIYKWGNNIDDLIKICRDDIQIDGVELILANKKLLEDIILSNDNIKWLKNLKHLTLHAPAKIVSDSNNDLDIENQLVMIQNIYDRVNAKTVVFHVANLPKLKLLNKFNFKFIIENTTNKGNIDLNKFAEKVKKYRCDICLDVAHAYTWSNKESLKYLSKFKNKIFQIHLSVSYGAHEHLPFSALNDDFVNSIKFLKEINMPIVVESDYNDKDVEFLIKDINAIRDFLYSCKNGG